jgi:hypothetical protein
MPLSQSGEQDLLQTLHRIATSLESLVQYADRAAVKFDLPVAKKKH